MGPDQHSLTIAAIVPTTWILCGEPHLLMPLMAIGFGAYYGSNAPDWLEIPSSYQHVSKSGNISWQRKSVIKHRTYTHYWPIWIGILVILISSGSINPLHKWPLWKSPWSLGLLPIYRNFAFATAAFCVGCLIHLICDIPNPSGVPLWKPKRTVSLRLWRSDNERMNWLFSVLLIFFIWSLTLWLNKALPGWR